MISKWYQEGVSTSGKLWGRTFWVEETTEASSRDGRTRRVRWRPVWLMCRAQCEKKCWETKLENLTRAKMWQPSVRANVVS